MHFKKPLFFLSFISCILLSSSALAEQWGDFVYDIFSDSTVGIREYTGSGGDVVIPDTIDGMSVVAIMGGLCLRCVSRQCIIIKYSGVRL